MVVFEPAQRRKGGWNVLSLKEYATNKGISYEAVRKQVKRYKSELEGHISKVNRTQYLDDEAVAFLDTKRQENPVILLQVDKDEEIQRLSNENKRLLLRVAELQDALLREKDTVKELQTEKIALLEAKQEQEAVKKKSWWERLFGAE